MKRWTKEEKKFLRENATKMIGPKIAEHLGRSLQSVHSYAFKHGISLTLPGEKTAIKHSDEDIRLCLALHAEKVPLKTISKKMDISPGVIAGYIYGYRRKKITARKG